MINFKSELDRIMGFLRDVLLIDNEPVESVALFTTCLVDQFRPNAGFAAVHLLESAWGAWACAGSSVDC